jgi:hypothetical protein
MLDGTLDRIANWSAKRAIGQAILAAVILPFTLSACDMRDTRSIDTATEAQFAFEAYVAAINKGDTTKAAQLYDHAEGFHWIERGGVQYASGSQAAQSLKDNFPSGSRVSMEVTDLHSTELGPDAALLSAHFIFTALNEDSTPQYSFDGWMTVGMIRREDGWRIAGGQTGPGKSAAE